MKPPSIVIDHFLSTKWSKKLFTINHYELQNGKCIVTQELSAYVIMTDEGRKAFLSAWQAKNQDTIKHPFLDEKIEWGMAPYVQGMLLARYLRGDLDEYPPFFWK